MNHELSGSGVSTDGTRYTVCTCGWRSPPLATAAAAADALDAHRDDNAPPTPRVERTGRRRHGD